MSTNVVCASWITVAGGMEVTAPNAFKPTVDAQFAKVKDVTGAAMPVLILEQIAAQIYLAPCRS